MFGETLDIIKEIKEKPNFNTLPKIRETYRIVEEMITNMSDSGLQQMLGGTSGDLNMLYDSLFQETYGVLYGGGKKSFIEETSLNYLDKVAASIEETLRIENLTYFISSTMPDFQMNWHHLEWGEFAMKYRKLCLVAARDHGKCHTKGTKIRMSDGSLKNVEDVKVGDYVMGFNSKPRKVLNTYKGEDELYNIHQNRAITYGVNSKHILHFYRYGKYYNMGLDEILKKHDYYKDEMFGVSQNFEDLSQPLSKTRITKIEHLGRGEYYGFSIDGEDKLYLLEDGTITHNSYFTTNAYAIWKLYRYKSKQQFLGKPRKDLLNSERGAVITNEASLGIELMEILKDTIEVNDVLRERLKPKNNHNWAAQKIKCANGARLQTKSYGTKFRGRHPGWMVVDDFLDDSCLYSKDQRDKFINYFHSVLMNALLKDGDIIVVGTPFHSNDLYGDLKKKKNWRVFEYPSIFPDGSALWDRRYNLTELLEKRDDQGNLVFSREHLCRPVVSDSSIFPFDLINKAFHKMENYKLVKNLSSFPKDFNRVVTGCDFAISANVGADYSVFMTWGIDDRNKMWLLHFWRAKGRSYREQIAVLKSIKKRFNPDVMYAEANQFQQIFVDEGSKEGLPMFPHVTTASNKYNLQKGLPSLALLFERDAIRVPTGDIFSKNVADLFASELSSIAYTDKGLQGVGEHDDVAMCTWISTLAARHLITGFGATMI